MTDLSADEVAFAKAMSTLIMSGFGKEAATVRDAGKPFDMAAERERIALLVEQMGMWGYGTLAIAAAIRSGTKASELDDISSPADRRKLANRPWSAP